MRSRVLWLLPVLVVAGVLLNFKGSFALSREAEYKKVLETMEREGATYRIAVDAVPVGAEVERMAGLMLPEDMSEMEERAVRFDLSPSAPRGAIGVTRVRGPAARPLGDPFSSVTALGGGSRLSLP